LPGATHSQSPSLRARPSPCHWATAANPGCVLRRPGCAASRRPTAQCRSAAESGTAQRYRRPFGQTRIGAYATATAPFEADAGNAVLAQHGPEAMVGGRVLLDSSILARQARCGAAIGSLLKPPAASRMLCARDTSRRELVTPPHDDLQMFSLGIAQHRCSCLHTRHHTPANANYCS